MNKNEMKKLALLGIATGILIVPQLAVEAAEYTNSINLDLVLAKPSCKAHGGCGGLTAYREVNDTMQQDQSEEEEESHDLSNDDQNKKYPSKI